MCRILELRHGGHLLLKPKMDSSDYQDALREYLLPASPQITNGDRFFMQNNAPIHRSFSTKDGLETKQVKNFSWPALSPDLNPIENLWGRLTRKIYGRGRQFNSIADVKSAIVKSWPQVTFELRESLISSTKDRMFKVVQKKVVQLAIELIKLI